MARAGVGDDLSTITVDAAAIADALMASPDAAVACYDGWTLVDLARHVGQIHRWVTDVVRTRSTSRPSGGYPSAPEEDDVLGDWLTGGAAELVAALDAADPDDEVWTISRTWRDVGFWRRRMVLETAMHRWDAEEAVGRDPWVDDEVAAAGVVEALEVYMAQRLDGADVGGGGERVAFLPDGAVGRTLVLQADRVAVEDGVGGADATVTGQPLELWLLLSCRGSLDGVTVTGDRAAAARAVRAATLVAGPAG